MKNRLQFLFLLLTINCLGQIPETGIYNELILVRNDAKKEIIGYFNSSTGDGQISCIYEFRGNYKTLNDKSINVIAIWQDEDEKITGKLTCEGKNKFILKFSESLLGDMACAGASQDGAIFEIMILKKWEDIRIAKNDKTYFYKEPKENTKRKAYITDLDAVGVIEDRGEWLLVEYNGIKLTKGWVRKRDLYNKK
ncbi:MULTISPECIES: hypothetical protein [Flavobacterium]|uniref:hypothetical protein n=1 Tax=Flavobacterium TaxID=237 RepID=UPI001FCB6C00|nr:MULTISPECIES: hypothetical protein [Flavobacterium]UOK41604.1 hypothetical protein LZF87_09805 [Flavobacterium enshiense]